MDFFQPPFGGLEVSEARECRFKLGSQAVQECLGTWVFRQNICRMKVARKMLADNVQHDAVLESSLFPAFVTTTMFMSG